MVIVNIADAGEDFTARSIGFMVVDQFVGNSNHLCCRAPVIIRTSTSFHKVRAEVVIGKVNGFGPGQCITKNGVGCKGVAACGTIVDVLSNAIQFCNGDSVMEMPVSFELVHRKCEVPEKGVR